MYSNVAPLLITFTILSGACSNSQRNTSNDLSDEFDSDQIGSFLSQQLTTKIWMLSGAMDSSGTQISSPENFASLQYRLSFTEENSYLIAINCMIISGSFELSDSVLSITRISPGITIDCEPPPINPTEINDFIDGFFKERQLVATVNENQLLLRGIENDQTSFLGCSSECLTTF